jgi:hypothetical protein
MGILIAYYIVGLTEIHLKIQWKNTITKLLVIEVNGGRGKE